MMQNALGRLAELLGRAAGRLLRRGVATGFLELLGIASVVWGVAGWSVQAAQVVAGVFALAVSWRLNR